MNNELLEEIMGACPKKMVISSCKKLMKKCSFKSGASMQVLRALVYWLYVYEQSDYVLRVLKPTHELVFERNFAVWDFIFSMWGLEIRILKERGRNEEADEIVRTMESYHMVPLKDSSYEMQAKFEMIRRNDYTYTEYEDIITEAEKHSKVDARDYRMSALWDYIGNGATGLYPRFNENAERAEQAIQRYIAELREVR